MQATSAFLLAHDIRAKTNKEAFGFLMQLTLWLIGVENLHYFPESPVPFLGVCLLEKRVSGVLRDFDCVVRPDHSSDILYSCSSVYKTCEQDSNKVAR